MQWGTPYNKLHLRAQIQDGTTLTNDCYESPCRKQSKNYLISGVMCYDLVPKHWINIKFLPDCDRYFAPLGARQYDADYVL